MKLYIKIFFYLFCIGFLCNCSKDKNIEPDNRLDEVLVKMMLRIPATGNGISRAVEENAIQTINVILMEDYGNGFQFAYTVYGYLVHQTTTNTYEFQARLAPTDNPVKLYLVANAPSSITGFTIGATEQEVKEAVTANFTSAGFTTYLPMSGEINLSDLSEETTVSGILVRSIARADVQNIATNFTLTSVQTYRNNSTYQIIPNTLVNNIALTPSVPTDATPTINTPPVPANGVNLSTAQIYLPESDIIPETERRLTPTVVVVGGIFNGDTDTTYYRLDFVPDETPEAFGQILRNHRYFFTITEVLSSGWRTPDEAAENASSQVDVEIKVWEENTVYMVFDDANYFGVSSRTINVGTAVDAASSITVDTDLPTYELYWLDDNGNIVESIPPITLGGTFTDPDNLFTVSISPNGTTITITTNTSNTTGETISRRLLARAGRLQLDLTINQALPVYIDKPLNIYNAAVEIGSLGDYNLGANVTESAQRTRALVNMLKNPNNFGLSGTIPIRGVTISGQSNTIEFSAGIVELFDVLYMTYARNPNTTSVNNILNELAANPKKIAIVQYDNTTTNANMMTALGFTDRVQAGTIAFTIHEDAPDIIMDGYFGSVDRDAIIRCYDNIHGEIPEATVRAQGFTPILQGRTGYVVLAIHFDRRIIISGDIDLYSGLASIGESSATGEFMTGGGTISPTNNADKLIANLWAWIAETVMDF